MTGRIFIEQDVTWIAPECIKDLINKSRLKINYKDYECLYNMQVRCIPMWSGFTLTNKQVEELTDLDAERAKLHNKMTQDVIEFNNLPQSIYTSVRRALTLLMEEDYRMSQENKILRRIEYGTMGGVK